MRTSGSTAGFFETVPKADLCYREKHWYARGPSGKASDWSQQTQEPKISARIVGTSWLLPSQIWLKCAVGSEMISSAPRTEKINLSCLKAAACLGQLGLKA